MTVPADSGHLLPTPRQGHAASGSRQAEVWCLGGTLTCRVAGKGVCSQKTRRCSAGLPPLQTPSGRGRCLGCSAEAGS